jgi:hypothetical protein
MQISKLLATATVVLAASNATAVVRIITPVDSQGNPTGPSRTVDIPDTPDSSTTVQPVDQNGNPAGPPLEIPDAHTTPVEGTPDDGMVPEGSGESGNGDTGGEGAGADNDSSEAESSGDDQ